MRITHTMRGALLTIVIVVVASFLVVPVASAAADPLVARAVRYKAGREIARECGKDPISVGRMCLLGYVRGDQRVLHLRIVWARTTAASTAERRRLVATVLRTMAERWVADLAQVARLQPPTLRWADRGRTLIYDRDAVRRA